MNHPGLQRELHTKKNMSQETKKGRKEERKNERGDGGKIQKREG